MSQKFIKIARQKMASVVLICVEGYIGEEVKSILNPRIGDLKEWTGSGFFVDCPYGNDIIVTNSHVVKNAKTIEIMSMLTSEEKFKAKIVGIVKVGSPDVAILKLEEGELEKFKKYAQSEIPYLKLAYSDNMMRGIPIKAIGYPLGMDEPNITAGEITNFISGDRFDTEKFVTDAAINPGNSGGPTINENGEVVGINTSIFENADNIGFITPSSYVAILIKNIFEKNNVCFSDIGGKFQKNSGALASNIGMEKAQGVLVCSIDPGGFLQQCGVEREDIILSVFGHLIDRHGNCLGQEQLHRRNIFDIFRLIPVGEKVEIVVWRKGKAVSLSALASALTIKKVRSNPLLSDRELVELWGMTLQPLSFEIIESFMMIDDSLGLEVVKKFDDSKERVIVTHIEKGSPADLQEWRIGEVLFSIHSIEIRSLAHIVELVSGKVGKIKITSEAGMIGFFENCSEKKKVEVILAKDFF